MSKAFTSEENEDDAFIELPPLPPGTKNYMTLAGAQRMEAERDRLAKEQSGAGTDLAGQSRIQEIGRRLRFLTSRLDSAHVIDPLKQPKDHILFGATVTLLDPEGQEHRFRIVGIDEADLSKNWISWMSPLASSLLNKKSGETFIFQGKNWSIRGIHYAAE